MRSFLNWLGKKEIGFTSYFGLIAAVTIMCLAYALINASVIVFWFGPEKGSERVIKVKEFLEIFSSQPVFLLIILIAAAAFFEEIMYRWIWIVPALLIFRNSPAAVIGVCVLSSLLFGYAHGGFIYIPAQGVIGFVWCLLFLKNSGFSANWKLSLKGLSASFLSHFAYNSTLMFMFLITR